MKLWLDSGLSSDSKDGFGELWADIVAKAGLRAEVMESWRRSQRRIAFHAAKEPSSNRWVGRLLLSYQIGLVLSRMLRAKMLTLGEDANAGGNQAMRMRMRMRVV